MKKINYKAAYVRKTLEALDINDVTITMNVEDIQVEAQDTVTISKVLHSMEGLWQPLTYQIENSGKTLVLFDSRI